MPIQHREVKVAGLPATMMMMVMMITMMMMMMTTMRKKKTFTSAGQSLSHNRRKGCQFSRCLQLMIIMMKMIKVKKTALKLSSLSNRREGKVDRILSPSKS